MKTLFLIHGAWSTRRGFKYIEKSVKNEVVYFKYDCNKETLNEIVERAKQELSLLGESIVLGHSLGGLIALCLHDLHNCSKLITLASPLSGIEIHPLLEKAFAIRAPILISIADNSPFIGTLHRSSFSKPIRSFITTDGYNPLILDRSDGVVTIKSQEKWLPATADAIHVRCNHFEILQRDEVVHTINYYSE